MIVNGMKTSFTPFTIFNVKCAKEEVGENEMPLLVRVAEIKGRCSVYEVGDSFRLEDGYRLVSEIPLCMHSLAALLPYYNALRVTFHSSGRLTAPRG